jgi:hypothetical protein
MMETMEVLGVDPQDEVEAERGNNSDMPQPTPQQPPTYPSPSQTPSPAPSASARKTAYPAITAAPHPQSPSSVAPSDKSQKPRKGLTPEQKQKLQEMQEEQENIRKERVAILSKKLLDKISVWAETDRSATVTEAFKKKMQVTFA